MVRDMNVVDDDIIMMKRLIRQKLTSDPDIIEVLNNQQLDPSCPDDYLDQNIFAYIRVPLVQDTAGNYICFSVDDMSDHRDNSVMKIQYIQFVIFCHGDDIKTQYGVERHDLLGYLVREIFHNTNMFGLKAKLVYNRESTTDANYSCRTLKFELVKPNSLHKGVARNKYEF